MQWLLLGVGFLAPLLAIAGPPIDEGGGAHIDRSAFVHTLRVDPAGETLTTLTDAMDAALPHLAAGEGVRIVLAAGTYRETLGHVVFDDVAAHAALAIVGEKQGEVIISGSDVVTDWRPLGDGLFETSWPHDWGNWAFPWETPEVIGHRAEMVFADDRPLRQVLLERYDYDVTGVLDDHGERAQSWTYAGAADPATLRPWEFGVFEREENGDRLVIRLPAGITPLDVALEVSTRRQAFRFDGGDFVASGKHNLLLSNLTFIHFASRTRGYGEEATIALGRGSTDIAIDRCRFLWNNAHGLSLTASGATIRDSDFNFNGFCGIAGELDAALLERNETNFNNWRGAMGGQRGWWLAGMKLARSNGQVVRDHSAMGNLAAGVWYDIHNTDIRIFDLVVAANHGSGLFLELSQGPFLVERLWSVGNARALDVSIVGDLVVRDAHLQRTTNATMRLKDAEFGEPVLNWQWYERTDSHAMEEPLTPARFELLGSTLRARGESRSVLVEHNGLPREGEAYAAAGVMYRGQGNTFFADDDEPTFAWVDRWWQPQHGQSVAQWAQRTRETDATVAKIPLLEVDAAVLKTARTLDDWVTATGDARP